MNVKQHLTQLIGNTPMYEITAFDLPKGVRLFAKLEFLNIGGSIKDRLGVLPDSAGDGKGRAAGRGYDY